MPAKKKATGKRTRRQIKPDVPTYTFPDGTVVTLMQIPAMLAADFYNTEHGKPEPPMKVMEESVGQIEVPDEEDEDYKNALAQWEMDHSLELVRFCALWGVKTDPAADDPIIKRLSFIRKEAEVDELKYLWIMSKLTTDDSISAFIEAVIGQTTLTTEGVEEASDPDRFRDSRERKSSNGAQVQKRAAVGDSGTNPE